MNFNTFFSLLLFILMFSIGLFIYTCTRTTNKCIYLKPGMVLVYNKRNPFIKNNDTITILDVRDNYVLYKYSKWPDSFSCHINLIVHGWRAIK